MNISPRRNKTIKGVNIRLNKDNSVTVGKNIGPLRASHRMGAAAKESEPELSPREKLEATRASGNSMLIAQLEKHLEKARTELAKQEANGGRKWHEKDWAAFITSTEAKLAKLKAK